MCSTSRRFKLLDVRSFLLEVFVQPCNMTAPTILLLGQSASKRESFKMWNCVKDLLDLHLLWVASETHSFSAARDVGTHEATARGKYKEKTKHQTSNNDNCNNNNNNTSWRFLPIVFNTPPKMLKRNQSQLLVISLCWLKPHPWHLKLSKPKPIQFVTCCDMISPFLPHPLHLAIDFLFLPCSRIDGWLRILESGE